MTLSKRPFVFVLFAVALALANAACASRSFDARYGPNLRTVAVADQVTRPVRMANQSVGELRTADLRLEESVRTAMIVELRRTGRFAQVDTMSALAASGRRPDAVLRLSVEHYGLGREGFSGRFQPTLKVEGTLVRLSDNQELWSDSAEVEEDDKPALGHRMSEYQSRPEFLREDYASAARVTAIALTRDLVGP